MPENHKKRKTPPHLLWWSVGCVMLNFAIDATVNKYGSHWSGWIIVILWLLPLIPFALWAFLHERLLLQRKWVASQFAEHPISFLLIVGLFLVIGVWQTKQIISRFTESSRETTALAQPTPAANSAPTPAPQNQAPPTNPPPAPKQLRPILHKPKAAAPTTPAVVHPVPAITPEAAPAQQPTYGPQTCVGSACAQGPGSQAILNQSGVPNMTDEQQQAITEAMKPYAGITVDIGCDYTTCGYAKKLAKALRDAYIVAADPRPVILAGFPPGVSFSFNINRADAANTMALVMNKEHLIQLPVQVLRKETEPNYFGIIVLPNP